MQIAFVAGFGPIVRDVDESRRFWGDGLGIELEESAPQYFTNDSLDGVRAFALWPLAHAAESCFGTDAWPDEIPAPAAWLEFDVDSPGAVAPAADEMVAAGHRLLKEATLEPWGQTVARLLSPEGILVGIAYTPWLHEAAK
ncbi:MAG: glyoxalase [Chloroflexi bacterium]|nr:MAG: glyoxalase [Chloroflexota bacterium]